MKPYFCSLLTFLLLGVPAAFSEPETNGTGKVVYVIPIKDQIERALVYELRRAVEEAVQAKADVVIFDMNTPGGRLDATEEIINIITSLDVPTYTFVNPNAISAGAIISMATDHIYMSPGGRIGDAMPIMMSPLPTGGPEAMPADLKEKAVSPTEALIRSAAQRKGHDPELASAMVRMEKGYQIGDKVICEKGRLLTLTAKDAEQLVGEGDEKRPLLSEGTVEDIPELLSRIGMPNAQVHTFSESHAEKVARVIDSFPFSSILLGLGLLALYIEFKTPGGFIPGVIGVLLLGIWFWGHHIAGLAGMGDILLFIVGVGLIMAEVIFLPTMGMLGVVGLVVMILALLMAMMGSYPSRPWYSPPDFELAYMVKSMGLTFVVLGVTALIAARFLPKTALFHQLVLETAMGKDRGYQSTPGKTDALIGLKGKSETFLRPAGIGVFGNKRLDVVTRDGQFIEQGASIVIVEAHGNRILVEPSKA